MAYATAAAPAVDPSSLAIGHREPGTSVGFQRSRSRTIASSLPRNASTKLTSIDRFGIQQRCPMPEAER
jgi:hypothetical protein